MSGFANAFAGTEAAHKAAVMHSTWGHLAPKALDIYKGFVLLTNTDWGEVHAIKSVFFNAKREALEGGPWFYLQLNDFVYKVGSKRPSGGVYRFDGTYVRLKNGSGRFSGKTRTIIRSTDICLM